MRAQENEIETSRSRPHPRDNETSEPNGDLPGGLHRRSRPAEADRDVPILAPLPQPKEADRREVLAPLAQHDDATNAEAVQITRPTENAGVPEAHGRRRAQSPQTS